MPETSYLLDNASHQARLRFAALAAVFDPVTFAHLDPLVPRPGGRCWEVGAGGPSVPAWLAAQVGPDGFVLATDIDTSWLAPVPAGVEVRVHDVAADGVPATDFDLVHARLVLVHLPDRARALGAMVAAVRPGGWVVVEDFDSTMIAPACLEEQSPDHQLANRIRSGFRQLLAARGVDLEYGRKLPRLLRAAGLTDVGADANFPITHPAARDLERANTMQVADGLIASGHCTRGELDRYLSVLDEFDIALPPLVSCQGRKP